MGRTKYILFIILSVASLSSCKIGKRYVRPEMELPELNQLTIDNGQLTLEDSIITELTWQELFTDEVLQYLIHTALENNKDIQVAIARITEMKEQHRISFSKLIPDIEMRYNLQKEQLNYGGDALKNDPEMSAKAFLNWEVDLWGNLRWNNDAALAAYLQSVEARKALELTIVSEVATKYFELCALDRELYIIRHTVAARRESVRLAKLRFEGGLTSETAFSQAEVELARTEALLPDLERQVKIKESDLALLLGHHAEEIPRGISLSEQQLPESLPVGLSSAILQRRPDLRRAEQKLVEANAKVGVAQTDLFPKLRITGNGGWESEYLVDLLKSPAWFINLDLIHPLFAMGRNKAKVRVAKARYEQELYSYQKNVLVAFKEVHDAIISARKIKEAREAQARLETAADTYARLSYLQYINGITSYMDVLDAQRRLLDAQIALNNSQLKQLLATVQLYKALGGGF
ncbi:MAG: efflux transporter outer membrane subunit [Tannerellaceae bacterium]|nr:efflux transporter outer membrane subunit [Tannerellaceae bacterium]